VQLISRKLIAPVAGAILVSCVAGLGSSTAAGRVYDAPNTGSTSASGATSPSDAVLASRLLRTNVLVDHPVTVAGVLAPTLATQTVTLEQRARGGWTVVAQAGATLTGTFTLEFRPRRLGTDTLRVQVAGSDGLFDAPATKLDVFHRVLASWYAPGGLTACGEEYTAKMLGVANRTLPCGTLVTLHYHGRTVRVPVIDRGPYVAGRTYDLTWATKQALGAHDLTELWANR
jgi:hypothetical protein